MFKYIRYLLTFRYIKLISYISAKYLHNKIPVFPLIDSKVLLKFLPKNMLDLFENLHQQSKLKPYKLKYVYYYGCQIIIGGINKFLLLITLGILLNILPYLILTTISFVSLRIWSGGLHFDSYSKCAYISLLSFTIMALLAKYIYISTIPTILIFLIVLILILLYAPVEHPNRPIKNNEKVKFKLISIFSLLILLLVILCVNNIIICNSIVFGVLLAGIIMLPIINKLK